MEINPYRALFDKLNDNKFTVRNRKLKSRISMLSLLEKAIHQHRKAFRDALFEDFRKPHMETDITELYVVLKEIRHTKANLRNWARSQNVATPLALLGTSSEVVYEAKGVCLIISPWNYPVNLSLGPLVSAIAAGNVAILKPSEMAPHTSALLKKFVAATFNEDEVVVVEGGKEVSEQLLDLPFDHIFFTGSPKIGSIVMRAASKNLTSITLELGGKCPVYVHHDAAIKDAAAKITAAKLVNAGQSCIAPDYILAHTKIADQLSSELQKETKNFFDPQKKGENDYSSIVNSHHYNRLKQLLGNSNSNENSDISNLLPPVVVTDANANSELMNEEIFGPILPIIKIENEQEALKIIHKYEESLAVYIFTGNKKTKEFFRENTSSGSICYNECAVQFLNPALPFGGIHGSGIGRSHGMAGFKSFSNERVVFHQRVGLTSAKLLYPPYSNFKKIIVNLLLKYF